MEAEEISSLLEKSIPTDKTLPKNFPPTQIIGHSKAIKDVLAAIGITERMLGYKLKIYGYR